MTHDLPPTLHPSDLATILAVPAGSGWRLDRLQAFTLQDGRSAILKATRPKRGSAAYSALNALARLLGLRCLSAAPAYGGDKAQQVEVRRNQALAAAGVPVPAIWHQSDDFIVMERCEHGTLGDLIAQASAENALLTWLEGLHWLHGVHQKGQYLSQAFARNLVLQSAKPLRLAAIDFEDDPLEVMPLSSAQARDWVCYLHSTAWLLKHPAAESSAIALFAHILTAESKPVQNELYAAAQRLKIFRHLPKQRKPWGRDVVQLQAVADLLYRWQQIAANPTL